MKAKRPRQESNLVYDLRKVACESGTLQGLWKFEVRRVKFEISHFGLHSSIFVRLLLHRQVCTNRVHHGHRVGGDRL